MRFPGYTDAEPVTSLDREKSVDSNFQTDAEKANGKEQGEGSTEQVENVPWYKQRKQGADQDDPFGDEEGAEVKYKTMAWWYVNDAFPTPSS